MAPSRTFSYHKESNLALMVLIVIKLMLLEGVALHFFIHHWSPMLAWIGSFGHIYFLILVIAELRASTLNPIVLFDDAIHVRYGMQICTDISFKNMKEIFVSNEFEVTKEKRKTAIAPLFPKPNVRITLHTPIKAIVFLGLQKRITELYLFVDEPKRFYNEVFESMHEF